MVEIIDPQQTALSPEHIPPIEGAIDMVVHRADEQYRFLHDNAVVWHKGTLFAAWYNCPHAEIVGSSCIRGRRSADSGRTWSPVEVIAADHAGRGTFYVPVAFCSCGDRLYAFVSNMIAHDQVTRCETFILDEATDRWRSQGFIADHFLPNCAPAPMEDGHYLMAGRVAESSAVKPAYPAVAISEGHDLAGRWRMVRISERKLPLHPETTVWVNGAIVTAVVRGGAGGGVHLFTSHDYGRTWEGPLENNLPAADTKLYAGTLDTGQCYLIWNWPSTSLRDTLVIGVSRPGEAQLVAIRRIRHGIAPELGCGPQWSYPCAVEHDEKLYVIYTSEKKHSVMTAIPIRALVLPTTQVQSAS